MSLSVLRTADAWWVATPTGAAEFDLGRLRGLLKVATS